MAGTPCIKRLRKEISALAKAEDDPEIRLTPNDVDIKKWTATIRGPPDSPFEGRFFSLGIDVGADYPLSPPKITFNCKVWGIAPRQ